MTSRVRDLQKSNGIPKSLDPVSYQRQFRRGTAYDLHVKGRWGLQSDEKPVFDAVDKFSWRRAQHGLLNIVLRLRLNRCAHMCEIRVWTVSRVLSDSRCISAYVLTSQSSCVPGRICSHGSRPTWPRVRVWIGTTKQSRRVYSAQYVTNRQQNWVQYRVASGSRSACEGGKRRPVSWGRYA